MGQQQQVGAGKSGGARAEAMPSPFFPFGMRGRGQVGTACARGRVQLLPGVLRS